MRLSNLFLFLLLFCCSARAGAAAEPGNPDPDAVCMVCNTPTGLSSQWLNQMGTQVRVNWGAVAGAQSYTLDWRILGAGNWTSVPGIMATNHVLQTNTCTYYEVRVQAHCGNNGSSNYSAVYEFWTAMECNPVWTNASSQVNCVFGEIHPTGSDHFHGAIDWNLGAGNSVFPINNGKVQSVSSFMVVVDHGGNYRKSRYLHINGSAGVNSFVSAGTSNLGTVLSGTGNNHLHLEMWQYSSTEGQWYKLNPFDNPTGWQLIQPADGTDPQITNVIIEPHDNIPTTVGSGYSILATSNPALLTNFNNGTVQAHFYNKNGCNTVGNIYTPAANKLAVYGTISPILNARDLNVNGGANGCSLSANRSSYSINNQLKYEIHFDKFREIDDNLCTSVYHTEFTTGDDRLFGNEDYIEMRRLNGETFLNVHKTVGGIKSNGLWCTKAKNGTATVFENTPTDIARENSEAKYTDGNHNLSFSVSDFSGRANTVQLPVIVDNFQPYIKQVDVIIDGEVAIQQFWRYSSSTNRVVYSSATSFVSANQNSTVALRLYPSEPLQNLAASDIAIEVAALLGGGYGPSGLTPGTPANSPSQIYVNFTGPLSSLFDANLNPKDCRVVIKGKDLGNNELLNVQDVDPISCLKMVNGTTMNFQVPQRNADGTWSDPSGVVSSNNAGQIHCFKMNACWIQFLTDSGEDKLKAPANTESILGGNSCLLADFDYTYGSNGCAVNFIDMSVPQPTSWSWDFGDGATSNSQNPAHIYPQAGCYDVSLTVSNGGNSETAVKQVCVNSCGTTGPGNPDCLINGPSVAGAGQMINLTVQPVGVGPFDYEWTTPAFIDPLPGPSSQSIQVTIPSDAENGTEYTFYAEVTDQAGNTVTCIHTVTVSGNIPDVELLVFGSFEPNDPLVLVGLVDWLNLTGPEDYLFTITRADGTLVQIPGSCLNTWLNGDYDCDLLNGLPAGIYTVCVKVRDAIGTYEDCKTINIGNVTYQPSPSMWLEVKWPNNPPVDPATGHFIIEPGNSITLGIDGNHPHPGYANCFPDPGHDEFFIVLHFKNLTTGEAFDVGRTDLMIPEIMYTFPFGLDWPYWLGNSCNSGTYAITADVFIVDCITQSIDFSDPSVLYKITTPIYIDVYPNKPPTIGNITASGTCTKTLTAGNIKGCTIETYQWEAFDPETGDVISNLFTGNTNSASVSIDMTHPYFLQFHETELVEIRIRLTIIDENGFTGERNQLIAFPTPLRIDLPSVITRCGNTSTPIQNTPIAIGGSGNYNLLWTNLTPGGGNVLSCLNCLDPTINAPASGMFQYLANLTDQSTGCAASKTITIKVQNMSASVGPVSVKVCGSGPGIYNNLGPAEATGGSGAYTYSWSPSTYLDDATLKSPAVTLPPGITTATFSLTVTDEFGCSAAASPNVTVTVLTNTQVNSLEAGPDLTVCHGGALPIKITPKLVNFPFYYQWESTNPKFAPTSSFGPIVLSETVNTHNNVAPQTYTYTVRLIDAVSGCYKEDAVDVTVHGAWKHKGYEPLTWLSVAGSERTLWAFSTAPKYNSILHPAPNSILNKLNIDWLPITPTDIQYNGGVVGSLSPNNGKFVPTPEIPQITMLVEHEATGCIHEYPSIKYLIADAKMNLTATPENGIVCANDKVCFDVKLDLHLLPGQESAATPPSVKVKYTITEPALGSGQAPLSGYLTLNLDSPMGLYTGNLCIENYFNQSFNNVSTFEAKAYKVDIELDEPDQFGPQDWIEQYQQWFYGYVRTTLYVEVSSGNYSPAPTAITTCIISATIKAGTTIDLGVGGPPFSIVCSNGTEMHWQSEIKARDYIRIQPHAQITLVPGTNGIGAHLYIDPCIPPGLAPDDPDEEKLAIKSTDRSEIENFIRNAGGALDMTVQPNPFTERVHLLYTLGETEGAQDVTISVYDVTGKLVQVIERLENIENGLYQTEFNAGALASGVYLYELKLGNGKKIIKRAIKNIP